MNRRVLLVLMLVCALVVLAPRAWAASSMTGIPWRAATSLIAAMGTGIPP